MKDMINLTTLKASRTIQTLTSIDLVDQTSAYICLIADELREARQPFYRIWFYQKQGWATGYTDETLKFLKTAFNRIKKNESTCQKVLNSRHIQTGQQL